MSVFSRLFKRQEDVPEPAPAPRTSANLQPQKRPALRVVSDELPLKAELTQVTGLPEQVMEDAIAKARASGNSLGHVLLVMKKITTADLVEAQHLAKEYISIDKLAQMPKWNTVILEAKTHDIMVVGNTADEKKRGFLICAGEHGKSGVSARISTAMSETLRNGWKIAGVIWVTEDFLQLMKAEYRDRKRKASSLEKEENDTESQLQSEFWELARMAFNMRASDIHITCQGGFGKVKFRIDGELELYQDWSQEYTQKMARVIYNTLVEGGSTQGTFSESEKQDGAIEHIFPEGLIRFRYAAIPITPNGFDITIRIIPIGVNKKQMQMSDLGYSPDQEEELNRMFAHSSGLIFFLGTTGSGKSTSMAVALEAVARAHPGKKIRTVEQPVEYRIEGAYQTSVDRAGFIPMIEQLMRMDPDYMMVGETRDHETAAAVLQGARSGHLCVSTLHADGAPLAYDRLQGLGIQRTELASVGLVVGIVYQKLVPVLCPHCKITAKEHAARHPGDPILERIKQVNEGTLDNVYFANIGGCPQCRGRGFKGRTVCAEILRPTVLMLSAIAGGNSRELWSAWRRTIHTDRPDVMRGKTAFEHAIWKMRQGDVSPVAVETEFRFLDEPPFEEH